MKIQTTRVFDETIKAINDGYRIIIHEGSTRSTKSYSAGQVIHLMSITNPNTRTLMVGVTLQIAKRNLLKDFKKILADDWRKLGRWKVSEMTYSWSNGAETMLISAENYEKYHGLDSDVIMLDEPNLYKEGGKLIEQLAIRCRGVIILTLNPSRKLEWLQQLLERPDTKYIHSTYKDNRFLEQRVINEIEARAKVDERFKRVYVEGKYVANLESAIFTNWNVSDFQPSKEESKKEVYWMDWGFANDPTVLGRSRYFDSKLFVKEFFRGVKMTTLEILEGIKLHVPSGSVIVVDNSEPRLVSELRSRLQGTGIQIIKTRKYKGSILTGIKQLQDIEIVIDSHSPMLLDEFESYSWKRISGELTDTPEDKNNHGIDGIRYGEMYINKYKNESNENKTRTVLPRSN